jgi:hypothetical protein
MLYFVATKSRGGPFVCPCKYCFVGPMNGFVPLVSLIVDISSIHLE